MPLSDQTRRARFIVTGQVQGVGFRPFVYRTALENELTGSVRNTPDGVAIEVQGRDNALNAFGHDLEHKLPPLARIVSLSREEIAPDPEAESFEILHSSEGEGHQVLISPDTATCEDCLAEVLDAADRRHLYAFTNCTNCGPRYTITRSIPYDRPVTSMACFPMCPDCQREYDDPLDRRFHAQPNACPVCGPKVWLTDARDNDLGSGTEALRVLARELAQGKVVAIKGLGGFHLACDPTLHEAVMALRTRKNRWDKPLAVMVPDLETARALAHVTEDEAELLTGRQRPIVLLRRLKQSPLSPALAPDTDFVGIMLPYTPLHHVLLRIYKDEAAIPALVMTSGNRSSEPISLGNREARRRLGEIADCFLFHDRDILIRTDDSVMRVNPETGDQQFFRRARGYTPEPVFLAPAETEKNPCVLGVGPELKNTLCLTKGDQAFVSQHIGDMENMETLGFYQEIAAHLRSILKVKPEAVVRDLHPDYMSTTFAREYAEQEGIPLLSLQHHFAHAHAVLAEHQHQGPALCLALDGTGYGEDKTLWGGELLFVDTNNLEHKRLARMTPMPLPGGETAIREPWRIAQGFLWNLGITEPGTKPWPWLEKYGQASALLPQLLEKNINCPLSSSCGRLFDAVSAMLGVCPAITYEGQAAIRLEQIQEPGDCEPYALPLETDSELWELDTLELFRQAHADWEQGIEPGLISRKFHLGLCQGLVQAAARAAQDLGVSVVGLSGGVMQNLTMTLELPRALKAKGLTPLSHTLLPPGDGCISLGQAAWARLKLAKD